MAQGEQLKKLDIKYTTFLRFLGKTGITQAKLQDLLKCNTDDDILALPYIEEALFEKFNGDDIKYIWQDRYTNGQVITYGQKCRQNSVIKGATGSVWNKNNHNFYETYYTYKKETIKEEYTRFGGWINDISQADGVSTWVNNSFSFYITEGDERFPLNFYVGKYSQPGELRHEYIKEDGTIVNLNVSISGKDWYPDVEIGSIDKNGNVLASTNVYGEEYGFGFGIFLCDPNTDELIQINGESPGNYGNACLNPCCMGNFWGWDGGYYSIGAIWNRREGATYWIFASKNELEDYLRTGDYSRAINYTTPKPSTEFDFYYRTRYGAEFPWPEDPEPGPDPGSGVIAGTLAHAGWHGSGSHNLEPKSDAKVVDVVSYNFLDPGCTYTMIGMMYDRTAGDFIDESYAEVDFTPEDVYGDVLVEMEFDASELAGHKLVAFQNLYLDGILIASFENEEDTDETIYILEESSGDDYNPDDEEDKPYFCAVDENFNAIGVLDSYESLIWTDRFDRAGDFELYTSVDASLFELLKVDNYFFIPQSDKHMIVEKIEISSDPDEGDKLTVTGRSLEAILDRRVIQKKTTISGNLQQGLKKILNENVIDPPVGERRIANFIFKENSDSKITNLTLDAEYFGDNIYDVVCDVCQTNHIGFRIRLNSSNQFVFELYSGEDRSYDNEKNNTYIIFGSEYDNVGNSNYKEDKENFKNVVLVGTSSDDTTAWTDTHKSFSGLSRRETYISATDVDKNKLTKEQYKNALADKGKETLKDYQNIKSFDGTMLNMNLVYLTDYGLGDIVEYKDEYGHELKSTIAEIIINHDSSGYKIYPTFEELKE